MNRDQRAIIAELVSRGWDRVAGGWFPEMRRGDVVARVLPSRVIEVLRVVDSQPGSGRWSTAHRIEYVHPLYGRTWARREANIATALATSKRTPRELGIMLHALGGGGRSRSRLGWRNCFFPGGGDDLGSCRSLADAGLMERRGDAYVVTPLGATEVGVSRVD